MQVNVQRKWQCRSSYRLPSHLFTSTSNISSLPQHWIILPPTNGSWNWNRCVFVSQNISVEIQIKHFRWNVSVSVSPFIRQQTQKAVSELRGRWTVSSYSEQTESWSTSHGPDGGNKHSTRKFEQEGGRGEQGEGGGGWVEYQQMGSIVIRSAGVGLEPWEHQLVSSILVFQDRNIS